MPRVVAGVVYSTMLCASAIFVGYVGGIALVLLRLSRVDSLRSRTFIGKPGEEQLHPLLTRMGPFADELAFARYPEYLLADPGRWIVTFFVVLGAVLAGMVLGQAAPLRMAGTRLYLAQGEAKRDLCIQWRRQLREKGRPWGWLVPAGLVAGLGAAVVGELHAVFSIGIASEAAWARGAAATLPLPPRPAVGVLAPVDAIMLVASASFIPGITAIVRAGRHFRSDPEVAERWCVSCGYPRPGAGYSSHSQPSGLTAGRDRCSECGRSFRESRARRRYGFWRGAAAFSAAGAMLFLIHMAAPAFVARVVRIPPPPYDGAMIPTGTVILIERPGLTMTVMARELLTADGQTSREVHLHTQTDSRSGNGEAFVLRPGASGTAEVSLASKTGGDSMEIQIQAQWSDSLQGAYLLMTPGGATSIRAVPIDLAPSSAFSREKSRAGQMTR